MKNAESSRILRMRILSAHTVYVFAYEQCRKNAWIKRLTSVCGCGKITVVILAGGAKAYMKLKGKHRMSIWRYLALGYLFVIMLGSVLLVLPFAAQEGQTTSYINALFTSASATCVTGLAPYDTNTHWSMFGKAVILILIQTGGLGFMTFVSVLLMMFRRGLGLYERKVVMQSYGGQLSGIKGLVKRIVIGSLACEFVGALLLSIRFIGDFGWGTGCWYAVWHSVSAFCNAGFDLMAGTHGGHLLSLGYYATDPLVSLTICGLIIIGGIGFCVWEDVISCRGNIKKFPVSLRFWLCRELCYMVYASNPNAKNSPALRAEFLQRLAENSCTGFHFTTAFNAFATYFLRYTQLRNVILKTVQ